MSILGSKTTHYPILDMTRILLKNRKQSLLPCHHAQFQKKNQVNRYREKFKNVDF